MASSPVQVEVIRFGGYEANVRSRELRRNGERVRLPGQSFEVLLMLLENPGELVTREEIRKRLWTSDTFVDFDHGLNNAVKRLRDALEDSAETPRFIETLPRRGYRFVGSVEAPVLQQRIERSTPPPSQVAPHRRSLMFVVIAFLSLLLVGAGLLWFRRPSGTVPPVAHPTMLAVLPFQNLSGDSSQDYFTDGLTEEMISQLGGLSGNHFGVIARTSSMMYKNTTKDIGQIGQELGVDYVLENSIRREGDHVRITVQLIRVQNRVHVWANSYDREVKHSIEVQEEVAREVVQQVQVKLGVEPSDHALGSHPINQEANDAYLRGRYFFNQFTEQGFRRAIEYFDQAIAIDSQFASAYSGLSDSYNFLVILNVMPPNLGFPKARVAAQRAVELDGNLSEAHTSLGLLELNTRHWKECRSEQQKAIALNPSNSTAHRWYAACLVATGRVDEAVNEIYEARRVDPLSMPNSAEIVRDLYYARRYERAVEEAKRIAEFDPEYSRTHFWLGRVYEQMGKFDEAIVEAGLVGPPDATQTLTETAYAKARAGKIGDARALLARLEKRSRTGFVPAYDLAIVNLALGEREAALDLLQKAFDEGDWAFIVFATEPRLDPLRSDPRFVALLKKLDIPQ